MTGELGQLTRVVRIKNVTTGDDRELYRAERIMGCVAAHRENVLFCAKNDDTGTEVVSLSPDSARTETRGTLRKRLDGVVTRITTDDRKILFYYLSTNGLIEWDIATGEERTVSLAPPEVNRRVLATRRVPLPGPLSVPPIVGSPDGSWMLYHDRDAAGRDGLYRIASEGGEPQRLGDYPVTVPTSALAISRDGRGFITHAPVPNRPKNRSRPSPEV